MQFIKKHYEKIILSVVLLGLAVASALLPLKVGEIKEQIQAELTQPPEKTYKEVDFTTNMVSVARLEKSPQLDLVGEHHLLNPVRWKRLQNGPLIKDSVGNLGPQAVVIEDIQPLYLQIEFGEKQGVDRARYSFYITQDNAEKTSDRRRRQHSAEPGRTVAEIFILKEVKGSPENPSELVIELINGNVTASVFPGKPLEYVEGHMADLRYPPENKTKPKARVGDTWAFAGEKYKIVAINANEVTFAAESTTKRTTIKWKN